MTPTAHRRLLSVVRRLRRRVVGTDPEAGAAAAFVVAIAVALLAVAGLVVDGGNAINARQRVTDDAEQAARAGSGKIDIAALRSGHLQIEPGPAEAASRGYLATVPGNPYDGSEVQVTATTSEVTVRTQDTVPSTILTLVGIGSFTVSGEATSRPAAGIDSKF